MAMSNGTEEYWDDFNGVVEPPVVAPAAPEAPAAASAAPVADDFPSELSVLLNKYGLEDVFYVALSADGATRARGWGIAVKPGEDGYRDRCARASFEATGLLQHMEGSTWPE